ncbi:uncharacterized protein DC041_0009159 [Schistosoma bovis]|uniref:Sodium-dependent transporter n=2 Tax=Schistosoma bovis TaxID=6184 RepID=A0A430QAG7_SCHBO|nr:uncharacterized protein DC041_0009159 [Schistosoma bovis]
MGGILCKNGVLFWKTLSVDLNDPTFKSDMDLVECGSGKIHESIDKLPSSEQDLKTHSKDAQRSELSTFNSSIGVLLSCLGCVIGTGNIWRFPRIIATASYSQGSLTFLIAWAMSLFVWSLPLSIVEYTLGRFTRTSPLGAFHRFLGNKLVWLGGWIVAVTYMITAYFSVIVGWCLYYFYKSCALSSLPRDVESSIKIFNEFAQESYWPALTHTLAVVIVGGCIFGGIKWIEKANMVLVPMLLGILVFTFGWSLTRKYSEVGITFLFTPYWGSMFTPSLWVAAASQNAFDTGAAMALFISYSSYFSRKNGAVRLGTMIPLCNNMVRIPVLFAYVGGLGRVLCSLFFLCLSFAGITSLIGHVQLTVVTAKDLGLSHRQAAFAGLFLTLVFGMPSAISINVLTNQDNVWGFALMLSGLSMAGLIIIYGPMKYRRVIVNDFGIDDWKLPVVWVFMISVLVPLSGTGLIIWWAYDLIKSNPKWYQLTLDSMTTTLLEWLIVFLILITVNAIAVWRNIDFFHKDKQNGYDPHNPDYIPKDELQSFDEFFIVSSDSVNISRNQMQTHL